MKNIKHYKQFNEGKTKDILKGIAAAGVLTAGAYNIYDITSKQGSGELKREINIDDIEFKKYDIYSNNMLFKSYLSSDGVISTYHTYSIVSYGDDDDIKTIHRYLINLPPNTTEFYYDKKFFDIPMASLNKFEKSRKVELKDLTVEKQTKEYTVYYGGALSVIDYIIVNHTSLSKGEEFRLKNSIGVYNSYRLNNDIYIIGIKSLGGGKFGGAGARGEWD